MEEHEGEKVLLQRINTGKLKNNRKMSCRDWQSSLKIYLLRLLFWFLRIPNFAVDIHFPIDAEECFCVSQAHGGQQAHISHVSHFG